MQVVIAGGGLAGLRTVEELRSGGFEGPITMLAAESRPPYDRPPLSKAALAGEPDAAELEAELDTTLSADFGALQVDLHLSEPAAGLDLAAARVRTEAGEYPYDRLVLATGAVPIVLPGPGRQRFLRTHEDALELRARLRPGVRLVIVGAGWIGAELATAAAARGCQVTVVEGGPTPLAAAIGAEVGARTVPWYAAAGIDLRTSALVESVEDGGLALRDGGWIPADEVVTAVGVRPAIAWLEDSGLALDNGVAVDPGLRASAPGVFAAGDCASFQSLRYGRRLRFEHWDIALHAPEVVAANIMRRRRRRRRRRARCTTRCRTPGPSSSAARCSTSATTPPPTACSGAGPGPDATSPGRGRPAGCRATGWWPCWPWIGPGTCCRPAGSSPRAPRSTRTAWPIRPSR